METSGVSLFVAKDFRNPARRGRLAWLVVNEIGFKSERRSAVSELWYRHRTSWQANCRSNG